MKNDIIVLIMAMARGLAIIKCKNTYSDATESMRRTNYYYLTILSKTTNTRTNQISRFCASIFECAYFSPSNKLSSILF